MLTNENYFERHSVKKLCALHESLVPDMGAVQTIEGEIVRAISRIGYRYFNDGDRIALNYGIETCDPAARYLCHICGGKIKDTIVSMASMADTYWDTTVYESYLIALTDEVMRFLEENPELVKQENVHDCFNYDEDCNNLWECIDENDDDEWGW